MRLKVGLTVLIPKIGHSMDTWKLLHVVIVKNYIIRAYSKYNEYCVIVLMVAKGVRLMLV